MNARYTAHHATTRATPLPRVQLRFDRAPGPHGPIQVWIYQPEVYDTDRPVLVWLHGGYFFGGGPERPEVDCTARHLAHRAGAVVVSADYRLAIDGVTYPAPLDDVVAVARWVRDSAATLRVDPARISLGGPDAGANLAIGAALRLRDDDGWQPAALLAVFPLAHPVLPPTSASLAAKTAQLPAVVRMEEAGMDIINTSYLDGPLSEADGYAFPALAELRGLCPTLVLNAEYDNLRASGEAFTAQLALAGVDVRQVMVPGVVVDFLDGTRVDVEPVDRTLTLMADVVATARAHPTPGDPA